MFKINHIALGVVALTLSTCTTPMQVYTDYNKTVDFTVYHTFKIFQIEQRSRPISQLNIERIISAVKAEMVKKGFSEQANGPDLEVNAVIILKDKQQVTANTMNYGYGGVYRPYGWGGYQGVTTYQVDNYVDGSLIIDIIDTKTNKLIWQGTGNKEIDASTSDPDRRISEAVAKILANFPPGAVKTK